MRQKRRIKKVDEIQKMEEGGLESEEKVREKR